MTACQSTSLNSPQNKPVNPFQIQLLGPGDPTPEPTIVPTPAPSGTPIPLPSGLTSPLPSPRPGDSSPSSLKEGQVHASGRLSDTPYRPQASDFAAFKVELPFVFPSAGNLEKLVLKTKVSDVPLVTSQGTAIEVANGQIKSTTVENYAWNTARIVMFEDEFFLTPAYKNPDWQSHSEQGLSWNHFGLSWGVLGFWQPQVSTVTFSLGPNLNALYQEGSFTTTYHTHISTHTARIDVKPNIEAGYSDLKIRYEGNSRSSTSSDGVTHIRQYLGFDNPALEEPEIWVRYYHGFPYRGLSKYSSTNERCETDKNSMTVRFWDDYDPGFPDDIAYHRFQGRTFSLNGLVKHWLDLQYEVLLKRDLRISLSKNGTPIPIKGLTHVITGEVVKPYGYLSETDQKYQSPQTDNENLAFVFNDSFETNHTAYINEGRIWYTVPERRFTIAAENEHMTPGVYEVKFEDSLCHDCPEITHEVYIKSGAAPDLRIHHYDPPKDPDTGELIQPEILLAESPSGTRLKAPVFSPRSQDGQFDYLYFDLQSNNPWTLNTYLMKPDGTGRIEETTDFNDIFSKAEWQGQSSSVFLWDGHSSKTCLRDGIYGVFVEKTCFEGVHHLFAIDNTPPIVKDVVLNEIHDVVNDTYSTDVSFTVVEPIVNGSHSALPTIDALESGLLKVYVDDAPFYASPVLDSDSFWITSLWTEPLGLAPGGNTHTATVSFTLPYRLSGHTMEVEVSDTVGNQGRYVLYPQGGNF